MSRLEKNIHVYLFFNILLEWCVKLTICPLPVPRPVSGNVMAFYVILNLYQHEVCEVCECQQQPVPAGLPALAGGAKKPTNWSD